ncbi:MAG: FAD/NAD(P)-binding protein [Candidatus Humimicrobiaceae bacterium]
MDKNLLIQQKPNSASLENTYIPLIATVKKIIMETHNIISLQLAIDDEEEMKNFNFQPGQVCQLSVFGLGESTFAINSSPSEKGYLQISIMKAGVNTAAIHNLSVGEKIGLRGPLGNWFPYKDWESKNLLFIGGGIGLAPLRPLILQTLNNKEKYGPMTLLYAARTPDDFCFKYDLEKWETSQDIDVILTIDNECSGWNKKVGLCPDVLETLAPSPENTIAVLCGPPIMIKFTLGILKKLKFPDNSVYTTLERRMKCGVGKCGRCNIGDKFVCVDGPVFSVKELNNLTESFI